jgi:putative ABC transport system substrate-binding protein
MDAWMRKPRLLYVSNRTRIMALALQHGLPCMAEGRLRRSRCTDFVCTQLGRDDAQRGRVRRSDLQGRPLGRLAGQRPTRIELAINLKTAKSLGIALPMAMRLRADEVIE